ncbi:NAD-binding protein [Hysterangium stoloniferum]|nr:NAD-binding protein [Hysterangium stoloniferum]
MTNDIQVTKHNPQAAVVTGAAQGIGRAIALRLAHDGYDISVSDLSSKLLPLESLVDEIKALGRNAIAIPCDVSKEEDVDVLIQKTVEELGQIRIMVANAGIGSPVTRLVNTSLEQFTNYMAVNLTGVFLCYRAAARQMLKQGLGGRIIGASSAAGKRGLEGLGPYSATKFGVRGLTQSLATELAREGITVNAYAPGAIMTALLQKHDEEGSAEVGQPPGTIIRAVCFSIPIMTSLLNPSIAPMQITERTPVGKYGTPENVAALVSYIASDQADFMTGQTVSLNGGIFYD